MRSRTTDGSHGVYAWRPGFRDVHIRRAVSPAEHVTELYVCVCVCVCVCAVGLGRVMLRRKLTVSMLSGASFCSWWCAVDVFCYLLYSGGSYVPLSTLPVRCKSHRHGDKLRKRRIIRSKEEHTSQNRWSSAKQLNKLFWNALVHYGGAAEGADIVWTLFAALIIELFFLNVFLNGVAQLLYSHVHTYK